jgi:hypothetical protein
MTGEWPQKTGQGQGNEHLTLEKREGIQLGRPDNSEKRQPGLTRGLKNGNDVRTLELEFVALNELGEHPDLLLLCKGKSLSVLMP